MRRDLAVCMLLVLTTFTVYGQVGQHDFVNYDDDEYVYENPHVRRGFTWENVGWAFTAMWSNNWHPLTWLSHMLDCELFGLKAGYHHLVNVFLHILNSILLYLVLKGTTGAVWRSSMVAALFALHPLHVESVAWVAERKDVLSTLFFMLTLWAYVRYVARPCWSRYGLVFGFLALGLMAKPMLVTVPFVLLLLDYWPLGRLRLDERVGTKTLRLVLEKVPLFVLVVASSVVTFVAQQRAGATSLAHAVPFGTRAANGLVSYVAYLCKMVWPSGLAVFYPYRDLLPTAHWVGAAVALLGVSALAVWAGRRWRHLAVGWFWYLGTLVPVIGLIQVGTQSMADRYTYIPLIGVFVIVVWGLAYLVGGWQRGRVGLIGLAGVVLVGCMVLATLQVDHWRSGVTLFEHTLKVTKRNAVAHLNLGVALTERGEIEAAIAHYHQAVRINPQSAEMHQNLGAVLLMQDKHEDAIAYFRQALRINPQSASAHNNLGLALVAQGKTEEALAHYEQALRIDPEFAQTHNNLGLALVVQGKIEEAITHYEEALRINPELAKAHNNLGFALAQQGKSDDAIEQIHQALRLDPGYADGHYNLGLVLAGQGKQKKSIAHYEEALRIDPEHAAAHNNLGLALVAQGKIEEAITHYEEVLRINPRSATTHNNIGIALARQNKQKEATEHYREAMRIAPEYAEAHINLGLSLVAQGRNEEGLVHCLQAVRINPLSAEMHHILGIVLAHQGRQEEAFAHYQEALRINPQLAGLYGNVGIVSRAQGERREASPPHGEP